MMLCSYHSKIHLKVVKKEINEGEIKSFPDKQKLREFVITTHDLQKMREKFFKQKGKGANE